jgi:hypothetical protein
MAASYKQEDGLVEREVRRALSDDEQRWATALVRFAHTVKQRLAKDPYLTLAVATGCGFVFGRGVWAYLAGALGRVTVAAALRPLLDEWQRAARTGQGTTH